jgi:transcription-repair coupling factor (superfamily II helicase)
VRHKERLKHLRQTVDVMSMTATPIPRTLYLSLMGARDMAVISTPPRDRLPVHTEVIPYDDDRISEAILREVERSGQVFFLHNRVETIEERARTLKELLPHIRFHVAHGQMKEHELERVMLDFLERRYDCLVTTMIIQSGLDMPNVNTILVDRADQFGLAELYQLRGRVGRSNHKAFAYLMVPKDRKLTPDARRRLRAIEEFSDLGSGFKVAMRDLEIRGAGNLLGNEQSGFIAAIGFELYVKLLDDAVKELKGESIERRADCDVDVRVSAFLPDTFVLDGEQKMALYRRLAESTSLAEVDEFVLELRDRFGRLPEPAEALVDLMKIKVIGRALKAKRIAVDKNGRIRVVFDGEFPPQQEHIGELVQRCAEPIEFRANGDFVMEIRTREPVGPAQATRTVSVLEPLVSGSVGPNARSSSLLVWGER